MKQPTQVLLYQNMILKLDPEVHVPGVDTVYLAYSSRYVDCRSALVIGCGAGLLALELASRGVTVTAVDINSTATRLCALNAMLNDLSDLVTVVTGDVHAIWDELGRYELVICNPPQLPQVSADRRMNTDWKHQANDAGVDGLDFILWLCRNARDMLTQTGTLMFTHFDFLDIVKTRTLLESLGFRVVITPGERKAAGLLSSERLERLGHEVTCYVVHIITADVPNEAW